MINRLPWLVSICLSMSGVFSAHSKVFRSMDEVLAQFQAHCHVEREAVYMTQQQREKIESILQNTQTGTSDDLSQLSSFLVRYKIECKNGAQDILKYLYFDTHRVRVKGETLAVLIMEHSVESVEVLSFDEPEEYLVKENWYKLFQHQKLSSKLALGGDIPPVVGSSLTVRAATSSVRRILAIHEALL